MKTIVLLHGAMGSEVQLHSLRKQLEGDYAVHLFNFSGHGGKPFSKEFSIPSFASELIAFCEVHQLNEIHLFGYSMGGYVALYIARNHPHLVSSIITLGTKIFWDKEVAAKEVATMQPVIIEQKVPAFAQRLQQMHSPNDWKDLMTKTGKMLIEMGEHNPLQMEDYQYITTPVLLMLGDRDKMVSLDETVTAFKHLPNSHLAVLPATPHPIEKVDVELLAFHINKFLGK
jgi:pimeloyl-ACP methyl ester carboxylesterase